MVARSSEDVLSAVRWSENDRLQLADAARRVLAQHTTHHRAKGLEAHIAEVAPARDTRRRSAVANGAAAGPPIPDPRAPP